MNSNQRDQMSQRDGDYQHLIKAMVHLYPWQVALYGSLLFLAGVLLGVAVMAIP